MHRARSWPLSMALCLSAGVAFAQTPAAEPDWGTVVNAASIAAGKEAAQRCGGCHNLGAEGYSGEGPKLFGVVGRQPGGHPAYRYSSAMTAFGESHPAWTFDLLDQFLRSPADVVPGTKMSFLGVDDPQARINMIAYLHTLGSDLPIPPPDPTRQGASAR